MITIYLGDVTEYVGQQAKLFDSTAQLLTQDNFTNLKPGVYYTSIGDLGSVANLGTTLSQADKIVYSPPTKWSDDVRGVSEMQQASEDYLNVYKFACEVVNYNTNTEFKRLLQLADTRKTTGSQLWIAGCSISHGEGVSANSRYGQLLADRLGTEVSFLTHVGSSIPWAADQILRSDVRPNDIVVWGLTSHTRFTKFAKDTFSYINVSNPRLDQFTLDFLSSDHAVYQSVTSVFQVINFCKKANVTLVIASLLDDYIVNYIQPVPNLVMLYKLWGRGKGTQFIDIGTDGFHPGIRSHQFYSDQIYQKIQELVATK